MLQILNLKSAAARCRQYPGFGSCSSDYLRKIIAGERVTWLPLKGYKLGNAWVVYVSDLDAWIPAYISERARRLGDIKEKQR